MGLAGTIIFSTVGRTQYGFDVFSVDLGEAIESRITDGVSINFNAQFLRNQEPNRRNAVVFVSERTGSPRLYLVSPKQPKPEPLPSISGSCFHDRPVVFGDCLYFISAHEDPGCCFKSWSALYSVNLLQRQSPSRLTPSGEVDFSPAISPSGKLLAVATYGSRRWEGDFRELKTDIVVFEASKPEKRIVVSRQGGWPTWSSDYTIFFHRQDADGWWSIFRADFTYPEGDVAPQRVTPPGLHCITPAAFTDGKRIAVATRRAGRKHRHIEIFDLQKETFHPVTETINPNFHHYNPFVASDSSALGYHRFRGESAVGDTIIPNLERIESPERNLRLYRANGFFPSFSPRSDLFVISPNFRGMKLVRFDGSRTWKLLDDRTAFGNFWNPCEDNVIFTSVGSIFQNVKTEVQIARVTFDSSVTIEDGEELPYQLKILTKSNTGNNAFPSCSPNGKLLVMRSGRSGHKNLYIIDAINGEEGEIRQLTDGPWIDTMPCWSPKGDMIAFSSNRHNPSDERIFSIYTVRPDGSELRRVHVAELDGVDRERINHVCFSADGDWFLFTANLGGVTAEPVSLPNQFQPYGDLYASKLDGSGLRRLTWNGYENGTTAWHSTSGHMDLDKLTLVKEAVGEKLVGQFDDPPWLRV